MLCGCRAQSLPARTVDATLRSQSPSLSFILWSPLPGYSPSLPPCTSTLAQWGTAPFILDVLQP